MRNNLSNDSKFRGSGSEEIILSPRISKEFLQVLLKT